KIQERVDTLEAAGFTRRSGEGALRCYIHLGMPQPLTLAGGDTKDALHYQERAVQLAIEETKR
ncbi:MAG: hypothetical protein HYZ21_00620, partial [Chloroflexi bacterium]|nr:hypothetical protein [Chloroflexota bacterium]